MVDRDYCIRFSNDYGREKDGLFQNNQKNVRQFTVFTAPTEHDSNTINTITYTCFNGNLTGSVMEQSVNSGGDTKFQHCI